LAKVILGLVQMLVTPESSKQAASVQKDLVRPHCASQKLDLSCEKRGRSCGENAHLAMSPLTMGFESHPPHHLRKVRLAQISLVLSVGKQKNDFKLRAPFDFA
jgi:hypothetical protein